MFLSIHLSSNRPHNIEQLVKNIENTASDPAGVEVIINIDEGDIACRNIIKTLQKESVVTVKYLETDIIKSFNDVWKPYNHLLKLTDPTVEFVTLFSDEFNFKTKGWDDILKKYVGYYEDDIFRIRISRYRFRNYVDFWECVSGPDSLAFYTKKWMDVVGMWCPCSGPDSWQQLVAYYLISARKFDHIQYNRDIVEPFIEFEGEGASAGLSGLKARQRIKDNIESWFETVSHEMQEKAKYAAALLQTSILLHENSYDKKNITHNFITNRKPSMFSDKKTAAINFKNNKKNKRIEFFYEEKLIYQISYKLNKIKLFLINNFRKPNYPYYGGGGVESIRKDLINAIYSYLRIRKYGDFTYKKFYTKPRPRFFSKHIWFLTKQILVISKIFSILLLKITYSEKFYRLIRRKINTKKANS